MSDLQKAVDFNMFPNPASNSVTITVDETMLGSTAIITDITGRAVPFSLPDFVIQGARRADESAVQLITNHQSLITTNFANGVYFVTVTSGHKSITRKLIVSR